MLTQLLWGPQYFFVTNRSAGPKSQQRNVKGEPTFKQMD